MAQCTAKSKQSGERCKRGSTPGMTVCYIHGGKSRRGIASGTFKDGRRSKDLPTRLAARYDASRKDPDLLNLTDEIAMTDAFIADATKGLDHGESGRLFRELKASWDDLQQAQRDKDAAGVQQSLAEIGALIRQGIGAYAARDETMGLVERRRRLVESEQKRRVAMQDMVTTEQFLLFLGRVTASVRRHVDNPAALKAIAADIGAIYGAEDDAGA